MPGPPPLPPNEGYLILDGEIIYSEYSRRSGERALSERGGTFGFLNNNQFWYLLYDHSAPRLYLEGIDLPSHDYVYVYERTGETYFVLHDESSSAIYFREGLRVPESEIIADGLVFLTKMTYKKRENGHSLSYGYHFNPKDVYIASDADIILGRGLLSSTDRLPERYEKVNEAITLSSDIWFPFVDESTRSIYKNGKVYATHENDENGIGRLIMLHDVIETGPVYWLAERNGPSSLFYGDSEIIIPDDVWLSKIIHTNTDPIVLLHDGSTDGMYSILYKDRIITSREQIFPESVVVIDDAVIKFVAYHKESLVEEEVQLVE